MLQRMIYLVMILPRRFLPLLFIVLCASLAIVGQDRPLELQNPVTAPFRFVAFGDTRFTDPQNTDAASAPVRQALVRAIAGAQPAFISLGGDISYTGDDANDWKVWDTETAAWRERHIPVYPALGNHDLKGDQKKALANYFQRFPDLRQNRYYSVRAANTLMFVLDSSLDEVSGPQGEWLAQGLDHVPAGIDFIFLVLHHPPYTNSAGNAVGGGHAARTPEQALGHMLEERQRHARARFVVFAGHVHNYERFEHGGVTYFVTGGGGAHPYLIQRAAGDPFADKPVNYHYLLVAVDRETLTITMNRLEFKDGTAAWTQPDRLTITVASLPAAPPASKTKAAGTN